MRLRATFLCGLGLLSILGCEKRIPKEELGTVVFEIPALPGAEIPPRTPELEGIKAPSDAVPIKHR
jgi:hypothetical protein